MSQEKITLDLSGAKPDCGIPLYIPGYTIRMVGGQPRIYKNLEPPKTYEECCKLLEISPDYVISGSEIAKSKPTNIKYEQEMLGDLNSIRKLKVCRDAWWKYLQYSPDFSMDSDKFVIEFIEAEITVTDYQITHRWLCFPTEKLAKDFLFHFEPLIDKCREYL
jgi:hypothetical protein